MTVLTWVMIAALIAIAGFVAIIGVVVGFKIADRRAAKKAKAEAEAESNAEIERLKKAEEERKAREKAEAAETARKAKAEANAAEIGYLKKEISAKKLDLSIAQSHLQHCVDAIPGADGDSKKASDALFEAMGRVSEARQEHALSCADHVTAEQRVTMLNGRSPEAHLAVAECDAKASAKANCLEAFDAAYGVQLATANSLAEVEAALTSANEMLNEKQKAVDALKTNLTTLLSRYEELNGSKYEDEVLWAMLKA